jgi:hypothetical protein
MDPGINIDDTYLKCHIIQAASIYDGTIYIDLCGNKYKYIKEAKEIAFYDGTLLIR